jgi:lipopolysaccharide export system permease protein
VIYGEINRMNRIDRFILLRMTAITLLVLVMLIFIFIVIDFSENSDDFTDRGATLAQIWNEYYRHYIPEMIRLVMPVAVFTACLLLVGQMTQRLEIISLKAAGVSLYRILWPFLLFALASTGMVSYLDGYVVPRSNQQRIDFERQYLMTRSDRVDRNKIYRQESANTLLVVNYYAPDEFTGYRVTLFRFNGERVESVMEAGRMAWDHDTELWNFHTVVLREFNETGYVQQRITQLDTTLTILPRDLARTTSDVFLLTYPEIREYIQALERIGASDVELPKVQYYGKLFYPFSILVITVFSVAVASVRRPGGTGLILGIGLGVSFLYLTFMKIVEPFGAAGAMDPFTAALLPHAVFLAIAVVSLIRSPK